MKHFAITGGIGSGKSTACDFFKELGISLYNADERAKYLMHHNLELISKIKRVFGEQSYLDQKLNRTYLANIVFNSPEKLKELNAIVHPAVHQDYEQWKEKQSGKYTLKEIAILFETQQESFYDGVITVTAGESVRIKRVIQRNKITEEEVKERIQNQLPESYKIAQSNYVIYNNGTLKKLRNKVEGTHKEIIKNL